MFCLIFTTLACIFKILVAFSIGCGIWIDYCFCLWFGDVAFVIESEFVVLFVVLTIVGSSGEGAQHSLIFLQLHVKLHGQRTISRNEDHKNDAALTSATTTITATEVATTTRCKGERM